MELTLTPEQDELFVGLREQAHAAQHDLDLFCSAVFRSKGLRVVLNVQRVGPCQLMGEIPDPPKKDEQS